MDSDMAYQLSRHAAHVAAERGIRREWIEQTLAHPQRVEPDAEDATLFHALAVIEAFEDRVLRVIYNQKHDPWIVVTVYFDRGMKGRL